MKVSKSEGTRHIRCLYVELFLETNSDSMSHFPDYDNRLLFNVALFINHFEDINGSKC